MGRLIGILVVVALLVALYKWMMRSKWFNDEIEEIIHPPDFDTDTDEVIGDITEKKEVLQSKATANTEKQEALKQDTEKIETFLEDGPSKTEPTDDKT